MCLVRSTIEPTLDRPCSTTESCESLTEQVAHLVGIDSCVVPVFWEEENQCGIMLFESGSLEIDHECGFGNLQRIEETDIRKGRVRLFDCLILGRFLSGLV